MKINNLDTALEQVSNMSDNLYAQIKNEKFTKELTENTLDLIRFHLGYTKSTGELGKLKLNIARFDSEQARRGKEIDIRE